MTRIGTLKPVFVEYIPDDLLPGDLYVTVAYATAVHRCCCGCGQEVVTPFSPTDWRLIFDGASVTLEPSIGNWAFPCRSHYWVRRNRVVWAEAWSHERVALARDADREAKAAAFGSPEPMTVTPSSHAVEAPATEPPPGAPRWWERIVGWLGGEGPNR